MTLLRIFQKIQDLSKILSSKSWNKMSSFWSKKKKAWTHRSCCSVWKLQTEFQELNEVVVDQSASVQLESRRVFQVLKFHLRHLTRRKLHLLAFQITKSGPLRGRKVLLGHQICRSVFKDSLMDTKRNIHSLCNASQIEAIERMKRSCRARISSRERRLLWLILMLEHLKWHDHMSNMTRITSCLKEMRQRLKCSKIATYCKVMLI